LERLPLIKCLICACVRLGRACGRVWGVFWGAAVTTLHAPMNTGHGPNGVPDDLRPRAPHITCADCGHWLPDYGCRTRFR